ncbi:MAG: polyketide synthase dehydratase domain-containing protein [bacterium]|nr:polyketide synthase dehydratase domain-containing protein [bacterium]
MSLERSEGVLCLVGADTLQALDQAIVRIQNFLAHSSGIRFIDVVYTATCDARGKACVAGLWVTSLEEMQRKLSFALNALRSGRTRMRDKSGVFFTTDPLALKGGKVAFIFPGTGSFHLEMMRDLALTFDGVRERFDDMEEAFTGFCDVASPSEWLFSTAPEHTLPLSASQAFLPLLASASTYLASKVFADYLRTIGVQPAAVGGIGLGAFSAFHATHHDPKLRLLQILRDAGRLLVHLGENYNEPWTQLTVTGVQTDALIAWLKTNAPNTIVTQLISATNSILAVPPQALETLTKHIREQGGTSLEEPLPIPFNTGTGDEAMAKTFRDFFTKYVNIEPQVPFYSCVTGAPMRASAATVTEELVAQMLQPLNFEKMINTMYDDGCRIFVEVGARGVMTPIINEILAPRDEPIATIPMHILHRSGGVQVGQATGLLAAHGVPIDYSGLRFFSHAKRLDFDLPTAENEAATLTLRLNRDLPALRPALIDTQRILGMESSNEEEDTPSHAHALPLSFPKNGLTEPLLKSITLRSQTPTSIELRCVLRPKDIPFLNDYAIGTSISVSNPQLRGLTLFSVSSGLELMAEVAKRLTPELSLARIEHLRAPRWLSYHFGKLPLIISAEITKDRDQHAKQIRVRIYDDTDNAGIDHVAMEANLIFAPTVPEATELPELEPLAGLKNVDWRPADIYPSRLFHGPLLRNVRTVSGWGFNGIDYEILIPPRANAVRGTRKPIFAAMPLFLDAVFSGFPLWRSHERFHGAISLPFRCQSITYHAVWIPEGTRLNCALRLVNVTPRTFQVDIRVTDATGHMILDIKGWEEVSGRATSELQKFVMNPAKCFITQPLPASVLPETTIDVVGALYVNDNEEFFISNHELWLSALANAVLTPNERVDYAQMTGTAPRRLEWLLGRTSAKEAVRRLLLQNYNLYEPAADIAIWKDKLGKPHPLGDWENQVSSPIDLSIAHTAGLILGAATAQGHIGLDVESVTRDLTEDFLRGVFTLEEQELASRSGDGPTAVLRFWCAKEAISKALGTGIRFAPTDLRIRTSDPATGLLEMELFGAWAEHFPMFREKLIPIKTCVLYGHAIACCILPNF